MLIGIYEMDVFGEASRSPERAITVDFLSGVIVEGKGSPTLVKAASLYRVALRDLCSKAGGSIEDLKEAKARYWLTPLDGRFAVTIEDAAGHRSTTEYGGIPGQRVKMLDGLGRLRPKPSGH
jgi:hypothetical protein